MFDPDSFFGKVTLSFIDKVIFAFLLVCIVSVWEIYNNAHERNNIKAEKISAVYMQRPIYLVEELSKSIRKWVSYVRTNRVSGIKSSEEKLTFEEYTTEVLAIIAMIEVYTKEQRVKDAVFQLHNTVNQFYISISTGNQVKFSEYQEVTKQAKLKFLDLSKAVTDESIERIKKLKI